jgi:hypothetical protein
VLAGGQQYRFGHGHAKADGQGVVEELFVGAPPEGVVDDRRAGDGCVFEERPIEGHVLGNAVDDDGVVGACVLLHLVDAHRFGKDAVYFFAVYPIHKGGWKGTLLAVEYTNFLHNRCSLSVLHECTQKGAEPPSPKR